MSKKANPTLIGGFILGALALLVLALFAFGSGSLFKTRPKLVTFFEGSVAGLTVGAPVSFRGVRIGAVTDIALTFDTDSMTARIPVYYELDPERFILFGTTPLSGETRQLIAKGLRARLTLQSVVTGQFMIELDFLPNTPATLVGIDGSVPEIPAMKSDFQELKDILSELPLQELVGTANQVLAGIDRLVNTPDLQEGVTAMARAMVEMENLMKTARQDIGEVKGDLLKTSAEARKALADIGQAATTAGGQVEPVAGDVRATLRAAEQTLRAADQALRQTQSTFASLDSAVSTDSRTRANLDTILRNLAQASASLRSFSDQLERNPNSLLIGRGQ